MAEIQTEELSFSFDELQMYFGDDYTVTDKIKIHQPTIGEVIDFGETKMFSSISPLINNPTSYRLQLWDAGYDWNKVSDYELFLMLYTSMTPDTTSLIFGDFNFSTLVPMKNNENEQIGLYDQDTGELVIDEYVYKHMSEYLRLMFNHYPKVEKAKGRVTKEAIIDEERMNLQIEAKKNNGKSHSTLLPLISSLLNHPGFKYKKSELREVGYIEFMDSVQRLQIYENVRALMSGMYSGMLDTSKMDTNKELNWMRDLHNDSK